MSIKTINKGTIIAGAEKKLRSGIIPKSSQMCNIVRPVLKGASGKIIDESVFNAVMAAKNVDSGILSFSKPFTDSVSPFDIPQPCASLSERATKGKVITMSVREMARAGVFTGGVKASSNSLITDWQTMWDALRIDISIRKAAKDTIRQEFYNIIDMPGSDRIFSADEFFPYATFFEINNGEGQSVTQGESRAGQTEPITHEIYAAGWTYTLLAELFDKSFDLEKVSESVMLSYNATRDDLSMSSILDFSYSGVQQTAASAVGSQRQELLYNTLSDGIDDLFTRKDPITNRNIVATDLALLVSPIDGHHVRQVINGFTNGQIGGQDAPKNLPALSSISRIVEYDGEVIQGRARTQTFSGVTAGIAYLVKKNRYMNVGIKRGLQVEADATPDVTTLAREERSWYFVEGQQVTGIESFIQEITLPTW